MSDSFEFAEPDLFTVGTIGPPGQRVFYLQAREGNVLVTLKCEKEQVRVLGEYLGRLLERLATPTASGAQDLALVEPATPAWVVGSIGVGYDEGADRVDFGGTICLAIATADEVASRRSRIAGGREWVRLGAVEMGLDCLRRYLLGLPVVERIDFEKV